MARQQHLTAHPDVVGMCQLNAGSQLQPLDRYQPDSRQASAELSPFPHSTLQRAASCKRSDPGYAGPNVPPS